MVVLNESNLKTLNDNNDKDIIQRQDRMFLELMSALGYPNAQQCLNAFAFYE